LMKLIVIHVILCPIKPRIFEHYQAPGCAAEKIDIYLHKVLLFV